MKNNVLIISGTRADFGLWESTIGALGKRTKHKIQKGRLLSPDDFA